MCSRWMVAGAGFFLLALVLGCEDDSTSARKPRFSEISDSTFVVGNSSVLTIENFAGAVHVRTGNPGVIRVTAEKWADDRADLDEIQVSMTDLQNGVFVTTSNPEALLGVNVDIDVVVPPDTRPSLQTSAGSVFYSGPALADCFFATAAGKVELRLPADVNVMVDLVVAAGSIEVQFPVNGRVEERIVDGAIGTGADGSIEVRVAAGTILVARQ